ncbi:nicotinamide riboside transporter PnuC [Aurantibacillus circumpalustris]|uniref:nicotinamide riboside transporter PnuC n=1 Tax=Aurantibacillus circumpalustris TaxID=3036359 RepID=UPI00295B94F7|nr:nicotinamide riboside transporter PnuC [Aurantibacillus circumpalustris]
MSLLGIIALITGTLGVWLTIKQTIWCWPFALISVVTSIIEFYNERLFGDMALQIFYFFAGVYGWIYWTQKMNETFLVKKMNLRYIPLYILITVVQAVVYYYLLIYYKGDRPLLDSILTACSLTTTYMMTKKYVENWIIWVFIDATYILLYVLKDMWLFAVLNLIFTVIAFYGWLKWRKEVL